MTEVVDYTPWEITLVRKPIWFVNHGSVIKAKSIHAVNEASCLRIEVELFDKEATMSYICMRPTIMRCIFFDAAAFFPGAYPTNQVNLTLIRNLCRGYKGAALTPDTVAKLAIDFNDEAILAQFKAAGLVVSQNPGVVLSREDESKHYYDASLEVFQKACFDHKPSRAEVEKVKDFFTIVKPK